MSAPGLDPLIHQPARLRIMGALYRNRRLNYKTLRDGTGLTDGNLASHVAKLEAAGYVVSGRVLANLAFEVVYRITPEGDAAFRGYLDSLRNLLAELDPASLGSQRADSSGGNPTPGA